jgi:hypothetical protein
VEEALEMATTQSELGDHAKWEGLAIQLRESVLA